MSDVGSAKFSCAGCGRSYAWKEQLAGKRVKCKCGHVMTVAESPPEPELDENALYDLADAEEKAAQHAPSQNRVVERPAPRAAPEPVAQGRGIPSGAVALPYQRGPTQRDKDRFSNKTLMDMNRDAYVPTALLVGGFAIYVGAYAFQYQLSGGGVAAVTLGIGLLTAFKAALLIGFALIAAGPLGVSFGGIYTAILKLAAIAVFSDGVGAWIEMGVAKLGGGGFGILISLPIIAVVYWALLTYLFSMDPGDSVFVVCCLAAFDTIVRWALLLILLKVVLSLGGVAASSITVPTVGGAAPPSASPIVAEINEMKERKLLVEANEFIAGGRQAVLTNPVKDWYAAGCKNVWVAVSRDINGRTEPSQVVLEMPKDKASRARVFAIIVEYYKAIEIPADPEDVQDDGEPFVFVMIR